MRRRALVLACLATTAACGELLGVTSDDTAPATDASTEASSSTDAPVDAPDAATDAASEAAALRKRVFVTHDVYAGGTIAQKVLEAGACQVLADMHSLDGGFVPWLTVGGVSPLGVVGDGPWYTLARDRLVATRADLTGEAGAPIGEDDTGAAIVGDYAWTGTNADGTPALDCSDWTDQSGVGFNGVAGAVGTSGPTWTELSTFGCLTAGHVYCFEK